MTKGHSDEMAALIIAIIVKIIVLIVLIYGIKILMTTPLDSDPFWACNDMGSCVETTNFKLHAGHTKHL